MVFSTLKMTDFHTNLPPLIHPLREWNFSLGMNQWGQVIYTYVDCGVPHQWILNGSNTTYVNIAVYNLVILNKATN